MNNSEVSANDHTLGKQTTLRQLFLPSGYELKFQP